MTVTRNEHRNRQNKKVSPARFKSLLEADTNLTIHTTVYLNRGVVVYAEVERASLLPELDKLDIYDIVEYQDYQDGVLVGVTGL